MAVVRQAYQKRGRAYTTFGTMIRCVRPDQSRSVRPSLPVSLFPAMLYLPGCLPLSTHVLCVWRDDDDASDVYDDSKFLLPSY